MTHERQVHRAGQGRQSTVDHKSRSIASLPPQPYTFAVSLNDKDFCYLRTWDAQKHSHHSSLTQSPISGFFLTWMFERWCHSRAEFLVLSPVTPEVGHVSPSVNVGTPRISSLIREAFFISKTTNTKNEVQLIVTHYYHILKRNISDMKSRLFV